MGAVQVPECLAQGGGQRPGGVSTGVGVGPWAGAGTGQGSPEGQYDTAGLRATRVYTDHIRTGQMGQHMANRSLFYR
ncbi:hypothetical protein GCM10010182_31210 [Actinomadura cremea]|nr:hypothetical protein GCM10010182_31210 [Actinomadura cremea]